MLDIELEKNIHQHISGRHRPNGGGESAVQVFLICGELDVSGHIQ